MMGPIDDEVLKKLLCNDSVAAVSEKLGRLLEESMRNQMQAPTLIKEAYAFEMFQVNREQSWLPSVIELCHWWLRSKMAILLGEEPRRSAWPVPLEKVSTERLMVLAVLALDRVSELAKYVNEMIEVGSVSPEKSKLVAMADADSYFLEMLDQVVAGGKVAIPDCGEKNAS